MLKQKFYSSYSTPELAEKLLGKTLVHEAGEGKNLKARIVETEAYLYDDPACHASNGRTKRTEPMFMEAGTAYVYLIYGMYHCFNVVSAPQGVGEAVLIRAVEPLMGLESMYDHRGGKQKIKKVEDLTNGPGKLCQAMQIDERFNKVILDDKLYISDTEIESGFEVVNCTRIGISRGKDLKLRYYIKGNKFVSRA